MEQRIPLALRNNFKLGIPTDYSIVFVADAVQYIPINRRIDPIDDPYFEAYKLKFFYYTVGIYICLLT